MSKITQADIERADAQVAHLCDELDITNADHIALWLETNMTEAASIDWLSVRIREAHERALKAFVSNPPRHRYWGAGEPDCPREILASNGELHTLRCKVCGNEDARSNICLGGEA